MRTLHALLLLSACRTAVPVDTGPRSPCLSPLLPATTQPVAFTEIPGGTFMMGSPQDEVGRLDGEAWHEVELSHDTCVQTTELTRQQFFLLMGYRSATTDGCEGGDCPLERVTWHEAAAFTNALNDSLDLPSCYRCQEEGPALRCRTTQEPTSCGGFRLPTEAEWERAARGGAPTPFTTGAGLVEGSEAACDEALVLDDGHPLGDLAWFCGNSEESSHPVGLLEPNAWGLYDAAGNVWEWTGDWYVSDPEGGLDPTGPETGLRRVARGGGWGSSPGSVRLASRAGASPDEVFASVGFRLARTMR